MDDLSSSNGSTSPGYVHIQHNAKRLPRVFDFHSGRKCPTCGGTGKIPKGIYTYDGMVVTSSNRNSHLWLCCI